MSNLHPGLVLARTLAMIVQTTGQGIINREGDRLPDAKPTDELVKMMGKAYGDGFAFGCRLIINAIDGKLDELVHERRKTHDEGTDA